jgi:mono/diheme cytochrome c family protein
MQTYLKSLVWLIILLMLAGCQALSTDHQQLVAERGAQVMPFDLERTTHIFEKLDNGGLQQVISDDGDAAQIALIRTHLADETTRFGQGDFHDPQMIHGADMAGLHELVTGAERITITYSDVEDGGQILFITDDADLIAAVHAWFDQQVADHGDHAMAQRTDASAPVSTAEASEQNIAPGRGMMGGGMMGGGMHVAHHAQIPDEYADLSNPVAADDASLQRGGEIFAASCAVCHGDGGMGDGPAAASLDPSVPPIAHTGQMLSDAYLFWRISEGGQGDPLQSAMPAWKGVLDEAARWDVINYVHALGQGAIQPQRHMGGMMFDPAFEQQQRQEMLDEAIDLGLIDREEADTFDRVHQALDDLMAETGLRMQGNNLPALLAILVERATTPQGEADDFQHVHDLLQENGLMR